MLIAVFSTKDLSGDRAVIYFRTEKPCLHYICVIFILSNLNQPTGGFINIDAICSNIARILKYNWCQSGRKLSVGNSHWRSWNTRGNNTVKWKWKTFVGWIKKGIKIQYNFFLWKNYFQPREKNYIHYSWRKSILKIYWIVFILCLFF